jgi:predicted transposase/invertase (TIGR01784 family)
MEALNLPRYSDNKIFKQLKEVTDIASLSPEERRRYDRDLKHLRDAYSLDRTYERRIKNARIDGMTEGEEKKVIEIARNLKAMGISVDVIAQGTGLSVDDVKAIGVTSFPNANCQE